MDGDDKTTRELLREIRDLQKESLDEYRKVTGRSVALQEEAVVRQKRFGLLYQRVLLVGGVLVAILLAYVVWLSDRL